MHLLLALLTIAAASDLQPVLPRLVPLFEQQTGHTVRVTFGSSGNFLAQIRSGAPFDVFLSADIDYPQQLEAAGLAEPETLLSYATGSLVLWTRKGSAVDVRRGLDVLSTGAVRRIAIANPDHAPYGRAAVAALRNSGLYETVRAKLVLGENVSQAAQFVQSANAEAGLIPLSLARSMGLRDIGEYVDVTTTLYPPIRQAAIIPRASPNKDAARAFLAFLKQPEVVRLLA
ncbi:MAG TPA: molybdate ABC transporter substrate-binding protein, partial [Vicinamibacterales bacterium]|nr:molybdate ABC transporter substrate-binding protein [Vicinamibacterales bacterium]